MIKHNNSIAHYGPLAFDEDEASVELLTCDRTHIAIVWRALDELRCPICAALGARWTTRLVDLTEKALDAQGDAEGARDDAKGDLRDAQDELARLKETDAKRHAAMQVIKRAVQDFY